MESFSKYHLNDLNEGEKVVKVIHRNWFYIFQQFLIVIAAIIFIAAGITLVPMFFSDFLGEDNGIIVAFVQNFFILAIWLYSFMIWIDYYFDIWIITTERIVNIEQKGLFTRTASELRFQKIQDVTTEVVGFLPTIFNYGDVKVQTAGEQNEFMFRTISDPYGVKNTIMSIQKKNEGTMRKEVEDMIQKIKA